MRGLRIAALVIALAAIVAPAAIAAHIATLRIVDEAPLSAVGAGFRAHESVRVTVIMNGRKWVTGTSASARGSFTVAWRRLRLDPCATPAVVSAYGPRTGLVVAKIPRRECAAP